MALLTDDVGELLTDFVIVVVQLTGRMADKRKIMTGHNKFIITKRAAESSGLRHILLELSRPKHGDDDVKSQKPGQYKSTDADNSRAWLIGSRSIRQDRRSNDQGRDYHRNRNATA